MSGVAEHERGDWIGGEGSMFLVLRRTGSEREGEQI